MAKRRTDTAKKRAAKKARQSAPGGRSKYAIKHAYLVANGLHGWEVFDKFWSKAKVAA